MATELPIPETRVLAIASHVRLALHVGNTMAAFVMQYLGCEVAAMHTVNYSNHTAYKRVKGRKTPADEIAELYEGLKQSDLNEFDMMLSGYIPSAEVVEVVGKIGRDLKFNAGTKPGSFFWVLDPVMGDNGKLYVPEGIVPAYKSLLREADLILPNQFEAEILSDIKIDSLASLAAAIQNLHRTYLLPHVIITSVRLPASTSATPRPSIPASTAAHTTPAAAQTSTPAQPLVLTIVGSTSTSSHAPRIFRIDVPAFPHFFSGTGDMFAALTVARLREAVMATSGGDDGGVARTPHWRSPDDVAPADLPLARAAQMVLASMHAVLEDTAARADATMAEDGEGAGKEGGGAGREKKEMRRHVARMKAAEVRVVRNAALLRAPPDVERFKPRALEVGVADEVGGKEPDELGVVKLG
ncbi:Ribokinase-like protein, partial [Lineolata rhizophorae]